MRLLLTIALFGTSIIIEATDSLKRSRSWTFLGGFMAYSALLAVVRSSVDKYVLTQITDFS